MLSSPIGGGTRLKIWPSRIEENAWFASAASDCAVASPGR
jgi:hypothetical protein